jgi:hypothetical protein
VQVQFYKAINQLTEYISILSTETGKSEDRKCVETRNFPSMLENNMRMKQVQRTYTCIETLGSGKVVMTILKTSTGNINSQHQQHHLKQSLLVCIFSNFQKTMIHLQT